MKDRIVIWGQDEKDTDVLIAIRLLQNSDIIKIWTFPKKGIDDAFVDGLFKDWKDGDEEKFPQPHTLTERGISEENMLPEGLKTPKTDVIKIAEQEWRVRVLSYRLYEHIKQQIEQLKVRVGNLTIYSKDVWEEAKDVSRSIKENTLDRNIKREQTTELRKGIDEVFDQMKKLQNAEQAKFLEISKANMVAIRNKVTEVLEKVGSERNTKSLWNKLLAYQQEVKGMQMTPRDRNALRLNFNEAFNALKADIKSNVGNRINARVNGLKGAIEKMETSIKRDKDNVTYQSNRINKNSTSQLEYQLRSAKLKLIEDRIQSKEQKLHDMYLTLKELEKKAEKMPKPKKVEIKAKQKVDAASAGGLVKEKKAVTAKEDASVNNAAITDNKDTITDTSNDITPKQEATEAVADEVAANSSTVATTEAVAPETLGDTEKATTTTQSVPKDQTSYKKDIQTEVVIDKIADTNGTAVETKADEAIKEVVVNETVEEKNEAIKVPEVEVNEIVVEAVEAKAEQVKEVATNETVEEKIEVAKEQVKVDENITEAVEANTDKVKEVVANETAEEKIEAAKEQVKVDENVTEAVEAKAEQLEEVIEKKTEGE